MNKIDNCQKERKEGKEGEREGGRGQREGGQTIPIIRNSSSSSLCLIL